jgi:prepilin-type N-terminal cleavage/methylation domain-containing protein
MLSRVTRRGFTLVELMIATALSLIVSGAIYQLLVTTQRLARMQAEHIGVQSNVRAAVLILLNEVRELSSSADGSPRDNDVLLASENALVYRAMRGFGTLCQPSTAGQLRIARGGFSGYRDPQPGRDSALVYLGASTESPDDDIWLPVGITSVSGSVTCTGSGLAGLLLGVSSNDSLNGLPPGTPVRIFEIAEVRLYQSERQWWLGLRSVSSGETIQPLAGPLTEAGFRIEPLDREGRPTTTEIQSIRASVIGIGGGPAGIEASVQAREELVGQVALRNAVGW